MKREVTIAREASISMGGFVFGQGVRFAYNLAAARLLGAEGLGVYALVVAVMQVVEALAVLGLDAGLLRFANLHEGDRRKRVIASAVKMAAVASILLSVTVILFAEPIAAALHGGRLLRLALCSAAAVLPFSVLTVVFGNAVQASRRLLPKVLSSQVISPVALLVTMIAARLAAGVEVAVVLPFIPSALLATAWLWPRFRGSSGVTLPDIVQVRPDRELLRFSLPLLAVSLFSMLSHWIDIVMLGLLSDSATVGLYHPAARTAGLLRSVLLAFGGIAAPMIAAAHARGDRGEVRSLYGLVTRWSLMAALLPAILLALFPSEVLGIFGSAYTAGARALFMLAASALLQAWFGLGSTVLAMAGRERLSLANQSVALLLQVLLHLLLIPRFGIDGAAASTLAVTLVLSLVRMAELQVLFGIPPVAAKAWKALASGAVAAVLLLVMKPFISGMAAVPALAAAVGASTAAYLLCIRIFRLEQEELEVILRIMPFLNPKGPPAGRP